MCRVYMCVQYVYMCIMYICVYRKRNAGVEDVYRSVCIHTFMYKRGYMYHVHMLCLYMYHAYMLTETDKLRLPVFAYAINT